MPSLIFLKETHLMKLLHPHNYVNILYLLLKSILSQYIGTSFTGLISILFH